MIRALGAQWGWRRWGDVVDGFFLALVVMHLFVVDQSMQTDVWIEMWMRMLDVVGVGRRNVLDARSGTL